MKKKSTIPFLRLSKDMDKLFSALNEGTDLACVLIGASYVNECLAAFLRKNFRKESDTVEKILKSDKGFLGSLSNKADLTYSLSLITKDRFNDIITIAEIRNLFAHSHLGVDFQSENISELCTKLNTYKLAYPSIFFEQKFNRKNNASYITNRDKFKTSVVLICQFLLQDGVIDEYLLQS